MGNLLEKINSPQDLKQLEVEQLEELSGQIRQYIIETVSQKGGHLASNLGVVELTVAMHYVFDFKSDKLLWDVGHQCYAHKILTGRKKGFANLRKSGGVSGFPNPSESKYDQFTVGHAGTAIPTAIGMALGQEQTDRDDKIVSLVGDASIVNGVSFEGLNNLGLVKRQMLVILNDNSMAIDPTQGAMAGYLSRLRLSHTYEDMVSTTNNILEHLPVIGKGMEQAIERFKKSIRMVVPASQMFESMDIPYFGPVDGHDVKSLVGLFKGLSQLNYPALLHVYTKKGEGFTPASDQPCEFHSTGPFETNGQDVEHNSSDEATRFTDVFSDSIVELADKDKRIVAITCAMSAGTGLTDFKQKFPDRFYDVGIAESGAVDIAAGLAKSGSKPVVCIYSTFLQRSFDQIFQEVSLQGLDVVFCIDRAGFVGSDGPTHHGLMDIGYLRMLPGVVLIAPANELEVKSALKFAVESDKCVCIRYPKDKATLDSQDWASPCTEPFEYAKSVQVRQGRDAKVAIVSYGGMLGQAMDAAKKLSDEGIEVDVINARFASPIDPKIVDIAREGKAIVTVEDHYKDCGFGSAVMEKLAEQLEDGINVPVRILGVPGEFIPHDTRKSQIIQASINADSIQATVRSVAGQLQTRCS